MNRLEIKKITLKGHASFYLREGWLSKGLEIDEPDVFRKVIIGTQALGVGSAMVKAIRYYLTASRLKNNQTLLNDEFGELVIKYDPYIETSLTKFLVHYNLVTNPTKATTWFLFFNYCDYDGMTKDEASDHINSIIFEANPSAIFSKKSLEDDMTCILNTYIPKSFNHETTPEDNFICPLSELGLLEVDSNNRLVKSEPSRNILNPLLVLYVLVHAIDDKDQKSEEFLFQTSVDRLMNDTGNIGKVFNLSRSMIYDYLEELQAKKYLIIHKTAGLDQVYITKEITLEEVYVNELNGEYNG